MEESRKHYRLSPSKSDQWINCPGSLALSDSIVEEDASVYAAEGTKAHGFAEAMLKRHAMLLEPGDAEMIEYVKVYTDFIETEIRSKPLLFEYIETTLEDSEIPGLGGTADYAALATDGTLYLSDLKYGVGVEVEAFENSQLLTYATIFDELYPACIDRVEISIVQPRQSDTPRRWGCDIERVREHRKKILESIGKTHRMPGEHCRWCRAKRICPEINEMALSVAQQEFSMVPTSEEVTRLVRLHQAGPAIRKYLDEIETHLVDLYKQEIPIPGHKVVTSMSHRRWKGDEKEVIEAFAQRGLSIEQITEPKLLTPAKIEKAFKKTHGKDVCDGLTYRVEVGHRLVPEHAKGEAIEPGLPEFDVIQ